MKSGAIRPAEESRGRLAQLTPSSLPLPPPMSDLSDLRIAILATDGFEQVELTEPKKALEDAGATVHVVSPKGDSIKGWDQDHWGESVQVDRQLKEATAGDYQGLVLPGGQINPDTLRTDDDALSFVKAFADAGTPIAAICHAPWILIEAGLAKGRRLTSYTSIRTDLRNAGADVQDAEVVVDDSASPTLVTSRNPDDLPAFNAKLKEVFSMQTA